ncbi:MAG: sulfite exporter TauE/SafE family protein [Hyphomicrobiaceae bacterium]|nr:sulfite exporter TauE/SafE family protein [Hyphomicrobiaceae bacterium]
MWDELAIYVALGFVAQVVDGALGMAYGVTVSSVLLSMGVPPAVTSACVHAAEVFTTGTSGLAHWWAGNIDRRLVLRLVLPGMIGGAIGAFALTNVPGELVRPWISAYLLALGIVILWKAFRPRSNQVETPKGVAPLGFFGGILDAMGGGGWGPLVTSTLVGFGAAPRIVIGSVNLTEFFVTLTISATFLATIGLSLWPIIAGLVVGGMLAAPFAALAVRHLPARALMIIVGCVVIIMSSRSIFWGVAG